MIGKFEANKDMIQELTSSGAHRVGNIAGIITGTVAEVTREIGEWVTDVIEMNEAAAAARRDSAPVDDYADGGVAAHSDGAAASEAAVSSDGADERPGADSVEGVVLDADIIDDSGPFGTQR